MTQSPIIRINGLTLYTHHGVEEAERKVGQRMVFDLELIPATCDAMVSDEVAGTVDYGELTDLVAETAGGGSYRTLERLVTVIAERTLDRFPTAASITVRATKPVPPIPFQVDGASVEITRTRAGEP
ncbi:MAG: dihydroneopterin aldolase [Solirubrobacterales bacterium]|nr:dihydroneopterin aldolase [Solirubrobacterales bacterium]MCZ2111081.1 dihydroneopterin aldolase [Dehalococcoidia bacterium]